MILLSMFNINIEKFNGAIALLCRRIDDSGGLTTGCRPGGEHLPLTAQPLKSIQFLLIQIAAGALMEKFRCHNRCGRKDKSISLQPCLFIQFDPVTLTGGKAVRLACSDTVA